MHSLWNLGRIAAVTLAALLLTAGAAQASNAYSHDADTRATTTYRSAA